MPEAHKFISGFGIHIHMNIAGYSLEHMQVDHITVTRYREYQYPIALHFDGSGNVSQLISEIKRMISGSRIINSNYGNPYQCNIDYQGYTNEGNGRIRVDLLGHSYRVKS
jgi:hypothetical protein